MGARDLRHISFVDSIYKFSPNCLKNALGKLLLNVKKAYMKGRKIKLDYVLIAIECLDSMLRLGVSGGVI